LTELTDAQIERWRILCEEANAHSEWLEYHKERDARRLVAQRELLDLLGRYLSKEIGTEQFRSVFDRRTRSDWDLFGLKGFSGAMFLNMCVKYIPNQDDLANHLRTVLPSPETAHGGREMMGRLQGFIGELISTGEVVKSLLQPAHIPFFVSAWWHLQDTERWPVFYVSARKALEMEELYAPTSDPLESYFAFREAFLALASALGIDSWGLEHLCSWYEESDKGAADKALVAVETTARAATVPRRKPKVAIAVAPEADDEETTEPTDLASAQHAQVQWLLAKIGRKFGCRIWIAANDRNKRWQGERLGALSLSALPSLGMGQG
jgi:hypothetical protein